MSPKYFAYGHEVTRAEVVGALRGLGWGPLVDGLTEKDLVDFAQARGRVLALLSDGKWHGATEVLEIAQQREGLRRLRDLRSLGFVIESDRMDEGSREWVYRLLHKPTAENKQLGLFEEK